MKLPSQNQKNNDSKKKFKHTLTPRQDILKIEGKIFYHESARAHVLIRLTKEVLQQYPQLRERNSSFSYSMILPRSQEELKKGLKDLELCSEKVPIILFLEREEL